MKKMKAIAALSIFMAITVSGCGLKDSKETDKNSTAETTPKINNETVTEKETDSKKTEISSKDISNPTEPSSNAETSAPEGGSKNDNAMPADAGSMINIAHSLALCESEEGLSYNSSDNSFFWNATSYLMSEYGIQSAAADIDEEGNLTLPSYIVTEFADAIFADYDGNTSPLPDIPASVTSITYNADEKSYSVGAGGAVSTKASITECISNGDGSYILGINLELNDNSGKVLGKYKMGIKPSTFTGSGHPLFSYTVTSFEKTN